MADEIGGVSIAPKIISAMIATVKSPRFRCLAVSSVIFRPLVNHDDFDMVRDKLLGLACYGLF